MTLLSIELRKEPTTCTQTRNQPAPLSPAQRDVVAYRDGQPVGRWPWWVCSKPTRRNRYACLNGYRYRVKWLADLEAAA